MDILTRPVFDCPLFSPDLGLTILISRFYDHFGEIVKFRSFLKVRKNFRLLEYEHVIYHFEAHDLENQKI